MKQVLNAESIDLSGTSLRINGNKQQGCFVVILERIKGQLDAMLTHHSRVLVVRLDLRMYEYQQDNELLSRFVRKVRKKLKAKYGFTRMGFAWAREQEKAKQQHYHFVLILDANKVRYPAKVIKLCRKVWSDWGQSPYTPPNCYYLVGRGSPEEYQEAFYRLSYLAKERGKGHQGKSANDYSTSRIKPR